MVFFTEFKMTETDLSGENVSEQSPVDQTKSLKPKPKVKYLHYITLLYEMYI